MPDETPEPLTRNPDDEVLVEGSWFHPADLPKVLGNYMRSCDDYRRQLKDGSVAYTQAREWAAWFAASADYWRTEAELYGTVAAQNYETNLADVPALSRERDEALARVAGLELRLEPVGSPRFEELLQELGIDMANPREILAEKVVQQRERIRELEAGTHPAAAARCQATTTGALFNDPNRCIWCELPSGHAGNHDAGVPQPGQPDARVSWPEPATQPDPAGWVVVTRNPEGALHRSATVWDNVEQANTAEGIAAGYADGTGCTAAVYELREVRGDA